MLRKQPSSNSSKRPLWLYARRLFKFAGNTLLTTGASLVVLPALLIGVGPELWGHFALAQSVSMFLAVLVAFGWGVTGAATLASLPDRLRGKYFQESLIVRSAFYFLCVPTMMVVLAILLRGNWLMSLIFAIALLSNSLTSAWFFVGEANPSGLFKYVTLPNSFTTVVGAGSTLFTHSIYSHLSFLTLGSVVSVLLTCFSVFGRYSTNAHWRIELASILRSLRVQFHAVMATAGATFYVTVPAMLVQIVQPQALPDYAMAERLYRFASTFYGPVQQVLQGWVPSPSLELKAVARRGRAATLVSLACGVLGSAALLVLARPVADILSGGTVAVSVEFVLPLSLSFVAVATSTTVGLVCLVALKGAKYLSTSTWLGAGVGVPILFLGAFAYGAPAVAWGVFLSETLVACIQLFIFARGSALVLKGVAWPKSRTARF